MQRRLAPFAVVRRCTARVVALQIGAAVAALLLAGSASVLGAESDEQLTVKLSRVKYGPFEQGDHVPTGSRIPAQLIGGRIARSTHDVPMYVGSKFGVKMRIDADRGERLQLATVWTFRAPARGGAESRAVTASKGSMLVDNHDDVDIWHVLDDRSDMVAGEWTVQIALIGVDEDLMEEGDDQPPYSILLYETTFDVSRPRIEEIPHVIAIEPPD